MTECITAPVMLPGADDTIVAVSTPPGRGAIAVVRVSGPAAYAIVSRLVRSGLPAPGRVRRVAMHDPDSGAVFDRPVVTAYGHPRSYTGEDLVELAVHGGELIPALAVAALVSAGARQAYPGEFTRRAVANGKMDILQAEAVADLVEARSRAMHRIALAQLEGGLSRRIATLREAILQLEALIAYEIDFPEEDDGPLDPERIRGAIGDVELALDTLLATARMGELYRGGALVVIAGAPNAGKSSLFNALLGSARAIVTPVPGTTRDAIEALLDLGQWPVRLVDTAGLHESTDVVERLGIEVSERYLGDADVVLACGESVATLAATLGRVHALTDAAVLPVRTKADLARERDSCLPADVGDAVAVSAHAGTGLDVLAERLTVVLTGRHGRSRPDAPLLTRERHRRAVQQARDEVAAFARAWEADAVPATVAAVHLRTAIGALEELVGLVDVEEILDRVFASFCVGK
jgi:tRNA modification GTPase